MSLQDLVKAQLETEPVTESDLKKAQASLNIVFPDEYVDFLKVCDGGLWNNQKVIMYSCGQSLPNDDRLLAANLNRPGAKLFFIGRFSEDEFGYLLDGISAETKTIYVFDHESEEIHEIASDLCNLFEKYSQPSQKKKKPWYSFLFS